MKGSQWYLICSCFLWSATFAFVAKAPLVPKNGLPSPVSMGTSSATWSPPSRRTSSTELSYSKRAKTVPIVGNNMLRGRIYDAFAKFWIPREKAAAIFWRIVDYTHWTEVLAIIVLVKAVPITRWINRYFLQRKQPNKKLADDLFATSRLQKAASIIAEIGLLNAFLYISDVLLVVLKHLEFDFVRKFPVQRLTAVTIFSTWVARNLSLLKWKYLQKQDAIAIRSEDEFTPDKMAFSRRLTNRILDFVIYLATTLFVFDALNVQAGFVLKSVVGLGSFGTLLFSLALREIVAQLLAGLAIEASNFFEEGDDILLEDGTRGIVMKMGFTHTHLRRFDELIVRIPNTQISQGRISNVSRTKLCQVLQTIPVPYEFIGKIPKFEEDIKEGIKAKSGWRLVTNGARPLRVTWTAYQLHYVEVLVDVHFRNRPYGDNFFALQQGVMEAIHEAAKKNGIRLGNNGQLIAVAPKTL